MRELTKQELSLLEKLFSIKEKNLLKALSKIMEKYYTKANIFSTKDYLYVTGEVPIALIAHLDTVHKTLVQHLYHDEKKGVLWSPEGLGADDRAGVFGILQILEAGFRPSIIFCTQEEMGGVGAGIFVSHFPKPKVKTNFLIELDRQGREDSVYYNFDNTLFENYINTFGFTTEWGTFSDISVISPAWKLPAVNLSIGYFNEHTKAEMLFYREMFKTIDKVKQILTAELEEDHLFEYNEIKYLTWTKWADEDYCVPLDDDKNPVAVCSGCQKAHDKKNMVKIAEAGYNFYFCENCQPYYIDHCMNCKAPFISWYDGETFLCEKCEKELCANG